MPLAETLERIREFNLQALQQALLDAPDAYVEPAYRNEDGSLATSGELDLPLRADLILRANDEPGDSVTVNAVRALEFDPISASFGSAQITIQPFGWDYARISARFDRPPELSELGDWFIGWFDPEDGNECDERGLYGVVHFMSDPEASGPTIEFTVDFGSAPVDALYALWECLAAMGASAIGIRRSVGE